MSKSEVGSSTGSEIDSLRDSIEHSSPAVQEETREASKQFASLVLKGKDNQNPNVIEHGTKGANADKKGENIASSR